MSTTRRTLRTDGLPDGGHPRWTSQLPPDRAAALPWLLLPAGVAGRDAMLVTPYERRDTGLTKAEADALAAMRRRLSAVRLPRRPVFIDAATGRASLLDVEPSWIARQMHDRRCVPVVPFRIGS
jgi:hypothetical protein